MSCNFVKTEKCKKLLEDNNIFKYKDFIDWIKIHHPDKDPNADLDLVGNITDCSTSCCDKNNKQESCKYEQAPPPRPQPKPYRPQPGPQPGPRNPQPGPRYQPPPKPQPGPRGPPPKPQPKPNRAPPRAQPQKKAPAPKKARDVKLPSTVVKNYNNKKKTLTSDYNKKMAALDSSVERQVKKYYHVSSINRSTAGSIISELHTELYINHNPKRIVEYAHDPTLQKLSTRYPNINLSTAYFIYLDCKKIVKELR